MDIGSILGLVIGFFGILFGYILEAKFDFGAFGALFQPTAISIVIGGTVGAVVLSFPMEELKKLPEAIKKIFNKKSTNEVVIINQLIEYAEKARKEGLLVLEREAQEATNPLMKKGLSLIVDGIESEAIRDILNIDKEIRESMHEKSVKIFESAGGFSPTMGVIGTVMGMVNILGHMGADTTELAHSIAVAFIATFYGVMLANIVYLPMASRLKARMEQEALVDDLIIEGLLSIQHGDNPRIIKEKLNLTLFQHINGEKPTEETVEK